MTECPNNTVTAPWRSSFLSWLLDGFGVEVATVSGKIGERVARMMIEMAAEDFHEPCPLGVFDASTDDLDRLQFCHCEADFWGSFISSMTAAAVENLVFLTRPQAEIGTSSRIKGQSTKL